MVALEKKSADRHSQQTSSILILNVCAKLHLNPSKESIEGDGSTKPADRCWSGLKEDFRTEIANEICAERYDLPDCLHNTPSESSHEKESALTVYNSLCSEYKVRGCIKQCFMLSLDTAMKMSTEEPAGCMSLQLQSRGLDQYKSIVGAKNCPRHKRQLQSHIWHIWPAATRLFTPQKE